MTNPLRLHVHLSCGGKDNHRGPAVVPFVSACSPNAPEASASSQQPASAGGADGPISLRIATRSRLIEWLESVDFELGTEPP